MEEGSPVSAWRRKARLSMRPGLGGPFSVQGPAVGSSLVTPGLGVTKLIPVRNWDHMVIKYPIAGQNIKKRY